MISRPRSYLILRYRLRFHTKLILVVNVTHVLLYTVFMQVSHHSGCGNDATEMIHKDGVICLPVPGTTPVSCGIFARTDHHNWCSKSLSIC